jgi:hypothetical protein
VRLPAARLGVGDAPALDADELGGRHGHDHAARRRRPKVAGWDGSGPGEWGLQPASPESVRPSAHANMCS